MNAPLTSILVALASSAFFLIVLAIWLSYRLGRTAGLKLRSPRFERLRHSLSLDGTNWQFDCTASSELLLSRNTKGECQFTQTGNRVRLEGVDVHGDKWSAEGICFNNHLSLTYVARDDRYHVTGALELDASQDGRVFSGIRTTWSPERGCVDIHPIRLSRLPARSDSIDPVGRDDHSTEQSRSNRRSLSATSIVVPRPVNRGKVTLIDQGKS